MANDLLFYLLAIALSGYPCDASPRSGGNHLRSLANITVSPSKKHNSLGRRFFNIYGHKSPELEPIRNILGKALSALYIIIVMFSLVSWFGIAAISLLFQQLHWKLHQTKEEHMQMTQKLGKKTNKLSVKNMFIATLTHEIRNFAAK